MSKFRKKPVVIVADQWFKNGDHPLDNSGPLDAYDERRSTEGAVVCDLIGAVRAKHEKNKTRVWGQPDSQGVVEHVEVE